jgi:signal transduction histidine kinase
MLSVLEHWSSPRGLGILAAVSLAGFAVLESLDAGRAAVSVTIALSGAGCALATLMPRRHLPATAVTAAMASGAVTLLSVALASRPEHTFGIAEAAALLLLIGRAHHHHGARSALPMTAVLTIAIALLPLRLSEVNNGDPRRYILTVLLCLVPLAISLGLRLRLQDRLRERDREAVRQAQRLDYARDLHDFVAHHVTAIVAQTQAVRFVTAAGQTHDPQDLDLMLDNIEQAGSKALASMRSMVSDLREAKPAGPPPESLPQLLTRTAEAFSVAGPPASVAVDEQLTGAKLPAEITEAAHRVVQESLTNVRKHAVSPTAVAITAQLRAGELEVTVIDDGQPPAGPRPPAGFGLVGLTERVEAAGGRIASGECNGHGWQVVAVLPVRVR